MISFSAVYVVDPVVATKSKLRAENDPSGHQVQLFQCTSEEYEAQRG